MLLVQVKKYFETVNSDEINTEHYSSMHISPVHIHKNKICHKEAIIALGDELLTYLKSDGPAGIEIPEYTPVTPSERAFVEH